MVCLDKLQSLVGNNVHNKAISKGQLKKNISCSLLLHLHHCLFFLPMLAKLLIAGGVESTYKYRAPKNQFEVIDLDDSTNVCNFDPQLYNLTLKEDTMGVGGLIDNNYPYFCGGRASDSDFNWDNSNKPVCFVRHKNIHY